MPKIYIFRLYIIFSMYINNISQSFPHSFTYALYNTEMYTKIHSFVLTKHFARNNKTKTIYSVFYYLHKFFQGHTTYGR